MGRKILLIKHLFIQHLLLSTVEHFDNSDERFFSFRF